MAIDAAELALRLAQHAEAVCRHYLSNGRREGRYWRVGDIKNTPGRSMYVRLTGASSGKGAAGRWTDAATAEYGDLLDVIRESRGLVEFSDVAAEARRFLNLPRPTSRQKSGSPARLHREAANTFSVPGESERSAQRLFAVSVPIADTLAETYLRGRRITALHETECLRFHPNCFYRTDVNGGAADRARSDHGRDADTGEQPEARPALIAAVTDLNGMITGIHRTYLGAIGSGFRVDKAPVETPRRSMGHLLGNGVRFGKSSDVMAAGEGIETILSLRHVLPGMPMVAALSANHLGAILFPSTLRRLYVARDNDAAGSAAFAILSERALAAGIEALSLMPALRDFNDDLRQLNLVDLQAALRVQLVPEDVPRFLIVGGEASMG
jgi:hypothetical protein